PGAGVDPGGLVRARGLRRGELQPRHVSADDRARGGAPRSLPGSATAAEAGRRVPARLPRQTGVVGTPPRPALADLRRRAPAALRPRHGARAPRTRRLRADRGAATRQPLPAPLLAAAGKGPRPGRAAARTAR